MVGGDAFAPKRLIGVPKVFAGREPAFSDANDEHDQEPKQDLLQSCLSFEPSQNLFTSINIIIVPIILVKQA